LGTPRAARSSVREGIAMNYSDYNLTVQSIAAQIPQYRSAGFEPEQGTVTGVSDFVASL